jgi:hypothetical protein
VSVLEIGMVPLLEWNVGGSFFVGCLSYKGTPVL